MCPMCGASWHSRWFIILCLQGYCRSTFINSSIGITITWFGHITTITRSRWNISEISWFYEITLLKWLVSSARKCAIEGTVVVSMNMFFFQWFILTVHGNLCLNCTTIERIWREVCLLPTGRRHTVGLVNAKTTCNFLFIVF